MRLTMLHILTVFVGLSSPTARETSRSKSIWRVICVQQYSVKTMIEVGELGQKDRSRGGRTY